MEKSVYSIRNIKLFIAFRVFFNTRLYYPVFTILFLDYGLTIEQFAWLNTVWAMTSVIAEIPSGAMADVIGRKKLLVLTSWLMIIELGLIAFVPLGNGTLIFSVFLINRVLSGLAEAMASGADEAIAYDSLVKEGLERLWPKVLSLQMRIRSFSTIVAVTLGAIIYDASAVNTVLEYCGISLQLSQQTTMRFPVIITFILAFFALFSALSMQEVGEERMQGVSATAALKQTLKAGQWILATPFALAIIAITMCYDHTLRMLVTLTSQYYRVIHLPDASFGIIGAAMAVLGTFTPKISEKMTINGSARRNLMVTGFMGLIGLLGLCTFSIPIGLLSMALIFTTFNFVAFFTSHYLNAVTASSMRATVLSFKGMAFNLSYGLIGILFAWLIGILKGHIKAESVDISDTALADLAFHDAMFFFPSYLAVLLVILFLVFNKTLCKEKSLCNVKNDNSSKG